ncbi:MAG TPA: hypothetical protein VFC78_11070 [Tepidisphaeraceae bacterium]|nr:hypothetical protein [Tepidisphaeraceae bacterium]
MSFPPASELDTSTQIQITVNGTTYNVWDEGRQEIYAHRSDTTQKAVWTLRCAWSDRQAIVRSILGTSSEVGGTPLYVYGWLYPDNHAWVAKTVQVDKDGLPSQDGNGWSAYQRARLTITFGIPEYQSLNTGSLEVDFSSNADALPGATCFFWNGNMNDPVERASAPMIAYSTVQFCQSMYNLPKLPMTAILAAYDCVNSTTFAGAAPGLVIFRGGKSRRNVSATGDNMWSIDYSFEHQRQGWNVKWKAGFGWTPYTDAAGNPVHASYDLNELLKL